MIEMKLEINNERVIFESRLSEVPSILDLVSFQFILPALAKEFAFICALF